MRLKPRPEIDALPPYVPGTSLEEAREATGHQRMVKLASNESLWGPSPEALAALQRSLGQVPLYPPMQDPQLIRQLAQETGLPGDHIILGNGADELLRLAAQAYVNPGEEIIFPTPSFSAYYQCARLVGASPKPVPLGEDGANDLDAVLSQVTANTRLVYLCAPNNPTGAAFPRARWQAYLERVPENVLTVVDGAYLEFCPDEVRPDFIQAIRTAKPVLLVRTFSKLYALAGLRIGWAAGRPELVAPLLKARDPFSVSWPAILAARASLADKPYFARVLEETAEARRWLTQEMAARGYSTFTSHANFVTVDVRQSAQEIAQAMMAQGFVVRPATSFGLPSHVRITVAPKTILLDFLDAWDRVLGIR
ncbi:MAG: histidinol-phosphate transaminase [Firmicutes bacterium]|nr:histidinol-phosphate transaminase [Bacillota bacterium]